MSNKDQPQGTWLKSHRTRLPGAVWGNTLKFYTLNFTHGRFMNFV
jgi:hypothetical protein